MSTAAADLRLIALAWPDLNDALGMPAAVGGFGRGLRSYMTLLDEHDTDAAAELRALERDPAQLGQRPIPIRLQVYGVMRSVEAALTGCAAAIAEHVQRAPISMPAPRRAAVAKTRAERLVWGDHARRVQAAQDDAADPRRWRWTGAQPSAPYAALWLLGRVQGSPGPFRPLEAAQQQHIARVAAEARRRVEQVLDTGAETVDLSVPCPSCGGVIRVYGGAGASPLANCSQCGGIWTEHGVIAA
ncbi:hypothetical protein [Streptomyces sp. NPDC088730]|uniref:hypothetical protein n=1 Tax=Streptomyces sp. NPDC088730 TaxID=3365877 RepID=UPI003808888A